MANLSNLTKFFEPASPLNQTQLKEPTDFLTAGVSKLPVSNLSSQTGLTTTNKNLQTVTNLEQSIAPPPVDPKQQSLQGIGSAFKASTPEQQQALDKIQSAFAIQGTSPANMAQNKAISGAIQDGTLDSTDPDVMKTSKAESAFLQAMAEARNAQNDPTRLDTAVKRVEETRARLESQMSELFDKLGEKREERIKLSTPGQREIEVRRQLNTLRTQAQQFKLQVQQEKLSEFEGQTLGFAKGRAAGIDFKASFRNQEMALQEQNLLLELGLEQELRESQLKTVEQQLKDFESDFDLRQKVEDKIFDMEQEVLDQAEKLEEDERQIFADILDNLGTEGVSFEDLGPEGQAQFTQLIRNAGLEDKLELFKAGLTASKARVTFENSITERQQSRLEKGGDKGTVFTLGEGDNAVDVNIATIAGIKKLKDAGYQRADIQALIDREVTGLTQSTIDDLLNEVFGKTLQRSQLLTAAQAFSQKDAENFIKTRYSEKEIEGFAKDAGFEGFFKGVGKGNLKDYFESPKFRVKIAELLEEQYINAGFTIE